MKKPHEQEWTIDSELAEDGDYSAVDAEGYIVLTTYSALGGEDGDREAEERLRFCAAAPDMVRALMAFIENAKDSDLRFTAPGPLSLAHDALRKAGVIP